MPQDKNIIEFPDPRLSNESGILCFGGEVNLQTLTAAYKKGVFPWPQMGYPMLWFSPIERGVLFVKELHVSQSLKKLNKKRLFEIKVNKNFKDVIEHCANVPRSHETGTWITSEIIAGYTELFNAGNAYCVEAWQNDELVGGLYGVCFKGFVSAESMFYLKDNASKICLLYLFECMNSSGLDWVDIQMLTPVTESMGGRYISREDFLQLLTASQKAGKALKL